MLLPIIAFLFASGLIVGGYAAITYLPGLMNRRKLDERLREVSTSPVDDGTEASEASVLRRSAEGPLPAIDRLVSESRAGSWLAKLIEQSGTQVSPSSIILGSIAAAVTLGFVAALFVRTPFVGPVVAVLGAFAPFGWLKHKRTVRINRFEEQFPDSLDLLSRAIRAGHAFQTALGMAADELPAPSGQEFKKTFDEQNFGLPLRDALQGLSQRMPLLDVRFFVTAVLIQRETGGNLSEILDNLSHVVRERFKIQRQVRVHTAHGRMTGYVLLALPAFLAIALTILNPDHMGPLFKEHMGQMMIMTAIVMQVVGYFWIKQVIKIEV